MIAKEYKVTLLGGIFSTLFLVVLSSVATYYLNIVSETRQRTQKLSEEDSAKLSSFTVLVNRMSGDLNNSDRVNFIKDAVEFRRSMDEDIYSKALGISPRIGNENADFEAIVTIVTGEISTYLRFCADPDVLSPTPVCSYQSLVYVQRAIDQLKQRLRSREIYREH